MSVNKVILVGNVGKDPETRYLDEGTAISKFPMATSETYRNKSGERVSNTEWHNVVLWRGLAQVAEKYVKKGTQIYIEGRIKTRSYDDANGVKKYITEIVGDQMQLLGKRPDDSGESGEGFPQAAQQSSAPAQTTSPDQGGQAAGGQAAGGQVAEGPGTGSQVAEGQAAGAPGAGGPAQDQGPSTESTDPFNAGDNGPDDLPF